MLTAAAHTPPVSRRVPQLVLSVVLSRVFAHARPTASTTQPSGAVAIGKLFERLCLPAASAESHPRLPREDFRLYQRRAPASPRAVQPSPTKLYRGASPVTLRPTHNAFGAFCSVD